MCADSAIVGAQLGPPGIGASALGLRPRYIPRCWPAPAGLTLSTSRWRLRDIRRSAVLYLGRGLVPRCLKSGRRLLATPPADASLACLASLLAVFVSLFLPFATLTCVNCPAMFAGELYRGKFCRGDGRSAFGCPGCDGSDGYRHERHQPLETGFRRWVCRPYSDDSRHGVPGCRHLLNASLHWSFSIFTVPMPGFFVAIVGSVAAVFLSCVMLRHSQASATPASPLGGGAGMGQGAAMPQR